MMKRFLLLLLLLNGARPAAAQATNSPLKIGAAEAAQHYDQMLTVTGRVAQVTLRPTIVFINLDRPFPDSPFAAIIHSKDTNQFSDLKLLKDRPVEITGKVINYHDRPEIVLEKASQLFVITNLPSAAPAPAPAPAAPAAPKGTNDLTNGVM
jgi:hypothetical protein